MKQALDIVSVMFLSREQAHREHLKTDSYSAHVALGDFYDGIIEIADEFAECFQGLYGKIGNVPYRTADIGSIDDVLEKHLGVIEQARGALSENHDKPLQNIIDTACGLYLRTLYKLRRFK